MNNLSIAIPSFDADGFMWELDDWDEATARRIARLDGVGDLDERQIALLRNLRASYRRMGALPAWAHVCHLGGFGADCMTRLFPDAREAWRIAGLPNPGEEAKAYL
ncbi:MAG: sulfite reductase [Hydrogenophilales bacterium CG17_big_fil_post_rev_8_21_14_2_50_63_12]|nr:MAG: sulfite reductase [Hydrogenophilales bacterium CG17_big_fil_post_rev_8_21_14_2_50_63_12]PIX95948.1 MAG: sulfite reductase [Hydrogenophilales bacterium CG_4_10_14_3_um_filter_63_21]